MFIIWVFFFTISIIHCTIIINFETFIINSIPNTIFCISTTRILSVLNTFSRHSCTSTFIFIKWTYSSFFIKGNSRNTLMSTIYFTIFINCNSFAIFIISVFKALWSFCFIIIIYWKICVTILMIICTNFFFFRAFITIQIKKTNFSCTRWTSASTVGYRTFWIYSIFFTIFTGCVIGIMPWTFFCIFDFKWSIMLTTSFSYIIFACLISNITIHHFCIFKSTYFFSITVIIWASVIIV